MSTSELLDDIRKPGAQILSIFLFLILGYASLVFLFGADIKDMYIGLRIFLIIEIIIIIISVIQFKDFFKYENIDNKLKLKKYAKFLTIINILSTYNVIFMFHNIFYVLALQSKYNLENFWLVTTTIVLLFCILDLISNLFILIELPRVEKVINGKLKSKLGIIFKLLAQLIFVEKIIEYFTLPYYLDNKFTIMVSIIIIFASNVGAYLYMKKYADFKAKVLED
ncbi:hypothetical protein HMPREF2580_09120 [Staphylococcus sp. HMSC036D05]|uniref:DUF5079 family protein n=1 Tax=Staphylococcus sp. HMSC036D05 TaxID=1715059 RepID=UPI0008A84176|nr:DUF5079 family protein [Staphylococcus sp. HMSC036D05]OHO71468.1 hypothetical protein HMPREF2580_09120 [Staphylococcus sp. HMSC036D05]